MSREWTLGGDFVVRHAGMPFDWLEALGAPDGPLAAARELLDAEDALRAAAGTGFGRLARAVEGCEPERLPSVPAALRTAADRWRGAAHRYRDLYEGADADATKELRVVLERPRVAEAVLLSNPDAYRNMLRPLLTADGPLNSRRRRARRQLYTYVQRFCAKNETVSFFGPMAYGTLAETGPEAEADTGPGPGTGTGTGTGTDGSVDVTTSLRTDLPRRRKVFLSHWAGRALARAVARDGALLPDLVFHRARPGGPDGVPPELPEGTAPELTRAAGAAYGRLGADGATLRGLVRATGLPARDLARGLRLLLSAGAADVRLGGGPYDLEPLRTLRGQLAELPPSGAREVWLERIAGLEACRAELEAGPLDGGPGPRAERIAALEAAFTAATGESARRAAGATYADRAVFYEEGASPFALRVGTAAARHWHERLRAVLEVCVAHGAATQRAATDAVRAALGDTGPLSLTAYAARAAEAFPAPGSAFAVPYAPTYPVADAAAGLARLGAAARRVTGDRYALVDLCVKASGPAELEGAALVVARVHHHLLVPGWLGTMHSGPRPFGADAERWVAEQDGRLVGFDFGRRNKGYYRFPGREVALRPGSWADAERAPWRPEDVTVTVGPGTDGPAPDGSAGGGPASDGPARSGPAVDGRAVGDGRRAEVRMSGPAGEPVSAYLPLNDFVKYAPFAALSHPQVAHPAFVPGDGEPADGGTVSGGTVSGEAASRSTASESATPGEAASRGATAESTAPESATPEVTTPEVTAPGITTSGITAPEGVITEVPEVTVDGVVLQRARWTLDTGRLGLPAPHARFLELRRIARRTGQRFLFCRSPRERKPYLLDLASPLAADLVAHVARDAGRLTAEAMSPGPEELWLRDAEGRRYTCELRMQVVGREVTG
ncbi:lantibiotic dehydratase [Streptomyces uncialis]|uniref:lantibiotic dehydratase n=1 Tax=Streptomyces uncialis TaxID=1048205 RepID=UPI002E37A92C|nr:lantibiotic dehydratase [Streptomyces uncialis]